MSTKRGSKKDDNPRNSKKKRELPPADLAKSDLPDIEVLIITNMDPIKLDLCWSPNRLPDLRKANLFAFLRLSERLPPVDVKLVDEFVRNYDPADGRVQCKATLSALMNRS